MKNSWFVRTTKRRPNPEPAAAVIQQAAHGPPEDAVLDYAVPEYAVHIPTGAPKYKRVGSAGDLKRPVSAAALERPGSTVALNSVFTNSKLEWICSKCLPLQYLFFVYWQFFF